MLSFCCMAFFSSPDKFKVCWNFSQGEIGFSGGNSRCSWISPSDVWISRLKKLYFPPRGIAFPPNQSGEIRFSLVGNLGKNNLFCSFFFKLELFQGEIFVLGNFPRRNSHFPHEKFPFPPFLSGETSTVVSHSSDLPKWKQIEKIN